MGRSVPRCKLAPYAKKRGDFGVIDDISGFRELRTNCAIDGYGFLAKDGDPRNPQEIPPDFTEEIATWPDPRPVGELAFLPSTIIYFIIQYTITVSSSSNLVNVTPIGVDGIFPLNSDWQLICTIDETKDWLMFCAATDSVDYDIEYVAVPTGDTPTELDGQPVFASEQFKNGIPYGDIYAKSATNETLIAYWGAYQGGGSIFDASATISFNAPIALYEWFVDDVLAATGVVAVLTLPSGTYTIKIKVTDTEGHTDSKTFTFIQP